MPLAVVPGAGMSAVEKLTDREREILQLIGRYQLSSKEAAQRVGIGYRRVNEICESAIRKLGVANRREALRLVMSEEALLDPRTESGVEPVRVPDEAEDGSALGVSKGVRQHAELSRPRSPAQSAPPGPYAPRSPHDSNYVGGPGEGLGRIGFPGQRALGERFRDGAVEGVGLPAGGGHAGPYPRSDRAAGRPSLFSWVRGGTRYAELTPTQRIGAVILMAALFVMVVGWVLTSALQTSNAIQAMLPNRMPVGTPWIHLGQ